MCGDTMMILGQSIQRLFKYPIFISLVILLMGVGLTTWNISTLKALQQQQQHMQRSIQNRVVETLNTLGKEQHCQQKQCEIISNNTCFHPIVWINGKSKNKNYLKHIRRIFSLLNYAVVENAENEAPEIFDILWNHEFPFTNPVLKKWIDETDGTQLINHVPGSGYYTSKVQLATLSLNAGGIPKAFQLPIDVNTFLAYAHAHPDILWVQKSNEHRGIKVLPIEQLNLSTKDTFVQQFVQNPLLIDGRKFDIGIYTVVTSISPLRVYIYDADILLRFCSRPYLIFDSNNVDQYVVGDDYTPVWEMPSFHKYYNDMKLSNKELLSIYLQKQYNINANELIYARIHQIIREGSILFYWRWGSNRKGFILDGIQYIRVFEVQNEKMRRSLNNHKHKNIFFELSRFDFIVDENFSVYLMEANMSPNLSSEHFPSNQILYESLLFNIFSLLGIVSGLFHHKTSTFLNLIIGSYPSLVNLNKSGENLNVFVTDRDLAIFSAKCETCECKLAPNQSTNKILDECALCARCITVELKQVLQKTYLEQLNKRNMLRIVPPSEINEFKLSKKESTTSSEWMTHTDKLQLEWLKYKCKHFNAMFC